MGSLQGLGWSNFFADQVAREEASLLPCRIDAVHRDRLTGISVTGAIKITLPVHADTSDYAVGDWVLADHVTWTLQRRLDRQSLLARPSDGRRPTQLVAANISTMFIVSSCNADFSLARLERYLALANDAGINPLIVLTKVDGADEGTDYKGLAAALQRGLEVVSLNARSPDAAVTLEPWCGCGSTVALVGSSGVGKSTLVNALVGSSAREPQQTGRVRESDSKGRHVTTARSLHAMSAGGWVIDTPGIRSLHVRDSAEGIAILFAEITDLAPLCKFRDCTHDHEPGCAVLAAVAAGTLDPGRLARWRKLRAESRG